MFLPLIQIKYDMAKDIVFAGIRYVQDHARPFLHTWSPIPYFVHATVEEYKVKKRCIPIVSDPYRYFPMFWEKGLKYLDTPVKRVFTIHVVLAIVCLMLNYLFIRVQRYHVFCCFLICSALLKQKKKCKPIRTPGKDDEKQTSQTRDGLIDEADNIPTDSIFTESDEKKQVQSEDRQSWKKLERRVHCGGETGVEEKL
jgi:hypothetical protein